MIGSCQKLRDLLLLLLLLLLLPLVFVSLVNCRQRFCFNEVEKLKCKLCVSVSLVQASVKYSGWMVVSVSAHVGRFQTFMLKNKKTYEKWITSCTLAAELDSTVFTLCFCWDSNIRPGLVHVPQSLEAGSRNPPTTRRFYNQPSINDKVIPAHRKPPEHRHWRDRISHVQLFTRYFKHLFNFSHADASLAEFLFHHRSLSTTFGPSDLNVSRPDQGWTTQTVVLVSSSPEVDALSSNPLWSSWKL